jgi:hypothetical protein
VLAALAGGALVGGLAVLRRNTRDAGELVPAAVAASGLAAVLLGAAVFMTPEGLVSMRDGAIGARDLLLLALSAGLARSVCRRPGGGVAQGRHDKRQDRPQGAGGRGDRAGCAECLAGDDAVCVQPAGGALFWFAIAAGLGAGLMRFLPAEEGTVERLSPVLVSAGRLDRGGGGLHAAGAGADHRRRAGRCCGRCDGVAAAGPGSRCCGAATREGDACLTGCDGRGRLCAGGGVDVRHAAQPALCAGQQDVRARQVRLALPVSSR